MLDRRGLIFALCAALALAPASHGQQDGFDPRGNFTDDRGRDRRDQRPDDRDQARRLSHDQLRAIVSQRFPVREMQSSGECGGEFWALIIDREGRRAWIILDVRDGRHLRTQSNAPACG